MADSNGYATDMAIQRIRAMRFSMGLGDWRELFLSITDSVLGLPPRAFFEVRLLGPTRNGERWNVRCSAGEFDALYSPDEAIITNVATPRAPDSVAAGRPKSPAPLQVAA